jgi:Holliday junction resolvase RusA-like endonuclease
MIAFRLPFPPSVNDMYLNNKGKTGRGRIPSPAYKKWQEAAGLMLNTQHRTVLQAKWLLPLQERCWVEVQLNDKRSGDVDNRIKPVLDLLVKQGVLKGDSKKYVRGAGAEWMDDLGDVECVALIYTEADRG